MTAGKVVKAEFIRSAHGAGDLLRDGRPEVAFVGRSNVGKSSLMNRLLGKKGLARTSSTPGRTRAVNYFLIDARWYCVDLPGYGYARAGKDERRAWGELVDHYLRQAKAWVVMLVDAKVGATRLDVEAFCYLRSLGAGISVVATKIDKLPRSRRAPALAGIRETLELAEDVPLLAASAVTGEGMKELWNEVAERLAALQVD